MNYWGKKGKKKSSLGEFWARSFSAGGIESCTGVGVGV